MSLFSLQLLSILFFLTKLHAQSAGDYRTLQTGSWNIATNWQTFDGSNWTNATTPPSSSNGVITIISGHVISRDDYNNLTVDQLVVNSGGRLNLNGGLFIVSDGAGTDLTCSGTVEFSYGTIDGAGSIVFNSGSIFRCTSGTITGSGSLDISAGAAFNQDGDVTFSGTRTINNYGTWNWSNGNIFYNGGTPTINNYSTFNINTDSDLYYSTGIINNKPTGIINKIGSPDNETAFGGNATFNNEGTINVNSSKINLNINSTNSGAINIAFGAHMTYTAGTANLNTGSIIAGDGNLNFSGGTANSNAGSIFVKNVNVSYGTLTVANTIAMGNSSVLNLFSSGTLKGSGTLNFDAGSTFEWIDGNNSGSGVININSGAIFNMSASTHYQFETKTINNYGTWNWTGGDLQINAGSPILNNYGVFNINADADTYSYVTNTCTFNNKITGVINKIGAPDNETYFSGISSFNNAGIINLDYGNLFLNVGGIHNGTYNVDYGTRLGGIATMQFTGDSFTNNGYIQIQSAGLSFSGSSAQTLYGSGSITTLTINNISGVTITEPQYIKIALMVKSNAKLSVPGDLILR